MIYNMDDLDSALLNNVDYGNYQNYEDLSNYFGKNFSTTSFSGKNFTEHSFSKENVSGKNYVGKYFSKSNLSD